MKISLRVHETHSDERDAQITGFLAMIAGKNPQSAAVDRNGIVKAELGGKVCDVPAAEGGIPG
jgi:hypothetical protein